MNDILAAWAQVQRGERTLTSFCALLASPETEDQLDWAVDADWDTYGDLMDLAGRYVEGMMDDDAFEALVAARLKDVEPPRRLL